jgi:hypothetical protein
VLELIYWLAFRSDLNTERSTSSKRTSDAVLIVIPAQLRNRAGIHVFQGEMVPRCSLPSNALIGGGEDTCSEVP